MRVYHVHRKSVWTKSAVSTGEREIKGDSVLASVVRISGQSSSTLEIHIRRLKLNKVRKILVDYLN